MVHEMTRKKIAQITATFPPYKGGIGNSCHALSKAISKDFEVEVFTPDYGIGKISEPGFKINYLKPLFKTRKTAFCPQLFNLSGFDAVTLHYPFVTGVLPTIFSCKARNIPLLTFYQFDLVGKGLLQKIFPIYNFFARNAVLAFSDKILVSSLDYARQSKLAPALEKNPEKFEELPNPVDTKRFKPFSPSKKALEKYNIKTGKKTILFVGALDSPHYFKGVDVLLKAFALMERKNARLVIVGDGDMKPAYQTLAKTLGISGKVDFAGFVSDEDLPHFYNACNVSVLPSIDSSEAFGIALVEAMACGKPVIATRLPGVRTVVRDEENGLLCEPSNAYDLAEKMSKILGNEKKAVAFGKRGLEIANTKYSTEAVAKKLSKIYQNAIKKKENLAVLLSTPLHC